MDDLGAREHRAFYLHFVTGEAFPMSDLYVEVRGQAGKGTAVRELGLDAGGRVVHRMPSETHRFGDYGIFDSAAVQFPLDNERSDLPAEKFEDLWACPDLVPPPPEYARVVGALAKIAQELRKPSARMMSRAQPQDTRSVPER